MRLQHGRVVLGLSRNLLGPPILSFLLAYHTVEHSFYASIIAAGHTDLAMVPVEQE